MSGIRKSRVVNGTGSIAAISIWQDNEDNIRLLQKGQEVSWEAFLAGDEAIETNPRMLAELHDHATWMEA